MNPQKHKIKHDSPAPHEKTTSVQRSRHPHDSPRRGASSVSHTKTLISKSIASSPYRGRPWRGWMFLCFFLCAKESKRNGVWGYPPARGNTSLCECYGIPQWVKTTFLQLFQKKFCQVCHSQTTPFRIVVPLPLQSGSNPRPS